VCGLEASNRATSGRKRQPREGSRSLCWLVTGSESAVNRACVSRLAVKLLTRTICHASPGCATFRETMRRGLASLVLGVLGWSFVAPLALPLTAQATAVCCRRNGEHHCRAEAIGGAASSDEQPALRNALSFCPYRAQIATPSVVARLATSGTTAHHSPSTILAVPTASLFADSHSHSPITQRGPPAQFLHR
jgi:hypothetical protein